MVDFRQLSYFIYVAKTGSLSRAALEFQVSHSVLSRVIQDFEIELGHRLFHRTGRGMALTEYGRQLLPRAQQVELEVSRFSAEASTLRGKLTGTVSIGLPGSVAALIALPLLQTVQKQHPDVFLRFVEVLSGGIEELLSSGRIDIGLYFASKENLRKGDIPLAGSNLYLIGCAGDRITSKASVTLAQVAQCSLMLPAHPHTVRAVVENAFANADLTIHVRCEIDSLLALKAVVASGGAHTVTSYDAVADDVSAGRLQASLIRDPVLTRTLVMAVQSKNSLTMASRGIADLIAKQASELIEHRRWLMPDL
jgi:LysR family transcriptional regulator, nitrogen assimilation regulatory protein